MSNLANDIKTGLKGVRGAGDALRGEVLDATDKAFDSNPDHPQTATAESKNRTLAEKGKMEMSEADAMIARREQGHQGATTTATGADRAAGPGADNVTGAPATGATGFRGPATGQQAHGTSALSGVSGAERVSEAHHAAGTTNVPASAPHSHGMTRPNDPQLR